MSLPTAFMTYSSSRALCANVIEFLPVQELHCRMKQKRTAVLSRIRDIVLAPNFIPSSVAPDLNACAAALPAAELSDILTQLTIEGHTALYWAIVNNRPQALWAFSKLITSFPSVCVSDLCIAYMITNDHAIFMKLKLVGQSEIWRLRQLSGCPPDEIEGDAYGGCASRCKSLLCSGIWHAEIGLYQHSHPARLNAVLLIEAHSRTPGCATPPEALKIPLSLIDTKFLALAPWRSTNGIDYVLPPNMTWRISNELGDWVMHNKTEYVDCEGTLHAKLEITLL
ncbi:hypothetical protein EV702DRAFT_1050732 [Suillus placidus]|uniref:Uncharacterized protein n=1 Tax=Suillus placidus TaxID=48579 RepID=A0A9P7CWB7_9AGAM|nr:hypothetical protein EV702DRAFT_1050732 [Suillus placidus]